MSEYQHILNAILTINADNFEEVALKVFRYQAKNNPVYQIYLKLLQRKVSDIQQLNQIPFLPISLFKTHKIQTGNWQSETIFTSSGTTGQTPSQHRVRNVQQYLDNTVRGYEQFYAPIQDTCVLALLPSYLERKGSSLIAMTQHLIQLSQHPESGFFLYNTEALVGVLKRCKNAGIPTLLIGVSFALLDLAEQYELDLEGITIMETGGMKGRRKEITRKELHQTLNEAFNTTHIHSEYGMTELLSQGYSKGNGVFYPTDTMRILIREITDPFHIQPFGRSGCVNIIDLANLDSCAFIATDDLGKVYEDGSFEILGRVDSSDMRGCNLMVF